MNELINPADSEFAINSDNGFETYVASLWALYTEFRYLTMPKVRTGRNRNLSQNALLHVWLTEYAAHLLKKHRKALTPGEVEGMKRHAKITCYAETHQDWLAHEIKNPRTGETKTDVTSSAQWKKGELTFFLDWLASKAAIDGLVLESIGEYKRLKEAQA